MTRRTASCAEAAFHFFCGYGSASVDNSEEVWTQIDEAIQCYHGNPSSPTCSCSSSPLPRATSRLPRAPRSPSAMKFDSENASGTLRMRSEQIVAAHKKRLENEK